MTRSKYGVMGSEKWVDLCLGLTCHGMPTLAGPWLDPGVSVVAWLHASVLAHILRLVNKLVQLHFQKILSLAILYCFQHTT